MSNETVPGQSPEPYGMGGIALAIDGCGNPVCAGCGAGGWTAAALANSGSRRTCYCPPPDRRIGPIDTRAEAIVRIMDALDQLERLDHPLTCRCPACDAVHTLRGGEVVDSKNRFVSVSS